MSEEISAQFSDEDDSQ